jgi:hypothetical protein
MANYTKESLSCQVQSECQALKEADGLPFRQLLDPQRIATALEHAKIQFRERVFSPMVTLWAFLSQVISSKDTSCEAAVSRVLVDRVAQNKPPCSADSSSYCQARMRLPEQPIIALARETGQALHREAKKEWLWNERPVVLVDGSTSTMADTEENQAEYPQSRSQKVGLGFPCLRMLVVFSLSVGTVLECVLAACRGKLTGEQSLFRQVWHILEPGTIVLADRLYDSYRDMAQLKVRGVDSLFGKKQSRVVDFRRGRKLGPNDHVVVWKKPKYDKSRFASRAEWEALPPEMEIRELRLVVRRTGFRTRTVTVVTTLLDAQKYTYEEVLNLFGQRWHCELDLRSIKRTLGMHHLQCKTPEMVRKELWIHLLAYNLIRVRMAQAAAVHGVEPRKLSFTAAKTHMHSFAIHMETASGAAYEHLENAMLKAIATCRVGERPARKEPRAVKKRQQKYKFMTKPRAQARQGLPA